MDEHEITTAPPELSEASPAMMDAILKAISELDIATHADVVELNRRQDAQNARIEVLETAVAELPMKFASAASLDGIKASQDEYEARSRKLTEQVGNLANVQADSQEKFTSIESRLNDLSAVKTIVDGMLASLNSLSGKLTTFMDTQSERLNNQQVTITEVKAKTEAIKETHEEDVRRIDASVRAESMVVRDIDGRVKVSIDRQLADMTALKKDVAPVAFLFGTKMGWALLGFLYVAGVIVLSEVMKNPSLLKTFFPAA